MCALVCVNNPELVTAAVTFDDAYGLFVQGSNSYVNGKKCQRY